MKKRKIILAKTRVKKKGGVKMKEKYEIAVLILYNFIDKFCNDNDLIKFKVVMILIIFLLTAWLEQRLTV